MADRQPFKPWEENGRADEAEDHEVAMQAVILAGGRGTRLASLTDATPKPMLRVGGHPFLEMLLRWFARQGVTQAVVCGGYRADVIRSWFGDGRSAGIRIEYSTENEPLGTAGAVRHAAPRITGERFLLANGDSITDASIASLVATHRDRGALVTMALAPVDETARFGSVEIADDNRVTSFIEKAAEPDPSSLVNAGLYVCERGILDRIPAGRASWEHDVLTELVGRGLYGVPVRRLIDIGTPESLAAAAADPWLRDLTREPTPC